MKHHHERPFERSCLQCLVGFTVEAWAEKNAPRTADGEIKLDAAGAIKALAHVMGEIVYHSRDGAVRHQFERFAHAEIERAFHAESIGNVIVVSFDRDAAA